MKVSTLDEIIGPLKQRKQFFRDQFGVTRMCVFGSFAHGRQSTSSDIDIVIEMDKSKKNLHIFLNLKRFLENEFQRSVDLGFEHTLKPAVSKKIKSTIIYV